MSNTESSRPYIPYIPKIPYQIHGEENYVKCITNRIKGEWQFLFREIKDIPSPYCEAQDYDFDTVAEEKWQDVTVPSSLVMQGFNIENNTEYYYRHRLKLPQAQNADRIIIRFEGVYSNARVWVNNQYIKTHVGGFTQWDCDLSAFAGEEITLIVGVTDVEGSRRGIWNPDGEKISSAAWASYYAHCNIGGIIRNVTVFTLPASYIASAHISTAVNGKSTDLKAFISAFSHSEDVKAQITLEDENKIAVAKELCSLWKTHSADTAADYQVNAGEKWKKQYRKSFENDEKYKKFYITPSYDFSANHSAEITLHIDNPKLWDAEHPNLYTLRIILIADGEAQQENVYKIGFREITYGGKNGTSKNKVYINGREIKLRGVCRHDVSHLYGRSVTKEDIYNEILTYKKNNINFIRTSHYPAEDYLLEVCDALGMYVEQENAACFKGANNFEIYNAPQEFLQSFAEMIESARNHTSVIIWSLANESDFEKTYAFRAEYDYVKKIDRTRPVIFSYPHLVHTKPIPYDIKSKHYAKVTGGLGDKDFPLLHDEFAHVSCYNIERLKNDNSVREFWGESIRKGWNSIFKTDGALGCAIWAATDDVFCIPAGTEERHQSHAKGKYAGYGEWGCVFDAFKREKPEAYLTKKAFTPVLLEENKAVFGNIVLFRVENRFDHTNLFEIKMTVTDGAKVVYNDYIDRCIEPHKSGMLSFQNTGAGRYNVKFFFNDILVDEYVLSSGNAANPIPAGGARIIERLDLIDSLITNGSAEYKMVKRIKANRADFKFIPITPRALFAYPDQCSLRFRLGSQVRWVSWQRKAQYSVYPNGHIGRNSGTAYVCGEDNAYGVKPNGGWEQDNENYFLYPQSEMPRRMSNDFMTRRNNILSYTISLSNGKNINILSDGSINARVVRDEKDKNGFELEITKGCFYPDLQWGNYFGKYNCNMKDRIISFSVFLTERDV